MYYTRWTGYFNYGVGGFNGYSYSTYIQFSNGRIFDLTGIIRTLADSLIAADPENDQNNNPIPLNPPIPLVTGITSRFEFKPPVNTISLGKDISPEDIYAYAGNVGGSLNLKIKDSNDGMSIYWFENDFTVIKGFKNTRIQFINENGQARVFDLTGIVTLLKDSLLAATESNPIQLFTAETVGYELMGVPIAGGEYALNYAGTGDLFTAPTLDPGTAGDDVINMSAGNDVINAKDGNDIVNAGEGNDTITGGKGNDVLNGGEAEMIHTSLISATALTRLMILPRQMKAIPSHSEKALPRMILESQPRLPCNQGWKMTVMRFILENFDP